MKKITFFMVCFSMLFGQTPEWESDQKALDQAKTLRWKATVFAGTVLLAIATGIAVISIDGGTPNHQKHHHKDSMEHHRNHSHHKDHCQNDHRDRCCQDLPDSHCQPKRNCCPDPCCNDFDILRNPIFITN